MPEIRLPVRQYRCFHTAADGFDEATGGPVARVLELDPERTAFITVDLWNVTGSDAPLVPALGRYAEHNFLGLGARAAAEARRRVAENLAPAVAAARRAGLLVIHSNSSVVVRRYPAQWHQVAEPAPPPTAWPSAATSEDVRQHYLDVTYGAGTEELYPGILEVLDFPAAVRPVEGDYCVCQQAAVDDLLARRGVTTVLFAGFLLGHCLLDNVGGLRRLAWPWRQPGCRPVLLRDCTLAQEYAATIDGFRATETIITWLEATGVVTAEAAALVAACG